MHLLDLCGVPIFEQLQIEEALLRADEGNWCLINRGAPPAIVMGISGRPERLLHLDRIDCPVIQRFSGGGTVVVDKETLFVTVLGSTELLDCPPFPERVMGWMERLLRPAFDHPDFALRENDFVIGERKCGGNAQYLRKGRFLHHATFLWDYRPERMALLRMPERTPAYRDGRDHTDFVCRLKDHLPSFAELISSLADHFTSHFGARLVDLSEVTPILERPHRQSTRCVQLPRS